MSLPPGFLDELRERTSISQVVGRKVMWDTRKSNPGKGDMWAPCPFHQEKSASFHVDDRKGYYYCFGCQAKGDALGFIQETENVSFMEAVEIMAREAGMTMPARDPQAQKKSDRRTQLAEVMEQAVQFYRLQLKSGAGAAARDYINNRGLSQQTQDQFDIGFAPDGWQNLWDHLTGKGVAEELILAAGLAKASTKGGKPYDTFRNRIMFPIRDPRKRCIAFGGRAMDPNDNAKYLNSPETELFDKGRSLYNHGPARESAGKGEPLIVAEGYMDVIALTAAGLTSTVAPLGTAVTETQLQLLWRISPEPVIALDGDKAGIGAAMRLIDLALPMLSAGQSLRFCVLPEGLDPDDLIKEQGVNAMRALVENSKPLVHLLWQRETEGKVFDSPERRSALDQSLRSALTKISDGNLRSHYGHEIKRLRAELFNLNPAPREGEWKPNRDRGPWKGKGKFPDKGVAVQSTKNSLLAQSTDVEERMREAVILAILIAHPDLLNHFLSDLETLDFHGEDHRKMLAALLRHSDETDSEHLKNILTAEIGAAPLEKLWSLSHVQIAPAVRAGADLKTTRMTMAEELAKLEARRGVQREVEDAVEDLAGVADEALTWRVGQAAEARNASLRSKGVSDGGDGEDRGSMSDYLQSLIDGEIWVKKGH
ncbi:DNA primase [Litoreibacter ascidiaceicola]|uniref:DNA primase n=1 Tax=Litoreibacter ascidiaceicola TaxID=1486859 RepID=A0A1M4U1C5_9RHOB|nr:DNA primase [Litoreibacter ascidiaceicola]SHE50529.1 DNA primase [Litoreibacter ascidiaceicola]